MTIEVLMGGNHGVNARSTPIERDRCRVVSINLSFQVILLIDFVYI